MPGLALAFAEPGEVRLCVSRGGGQQRAVWRGSGNGGILFFDRNLDLLQGPSSHMLEV